MKKISKYISGLSLEQIIIECVSLVICITGIVTSIRMNLVGHSLWYDEAALAYSFSLRDMAGLTKSGLEYVQSAPVGWLYLEKLFVGIVGNTDYNLRVLSIVFYILMLVEIYYVMRFVIKSYYVLPAVSFAATIPLLLQYSNVFKPYIADAFFCILIIIIYDLWNKGKVNIYVASIIWIIAIWFSSPSCFVVGGCLLSSFIYAIAKKDKKEIISVIKGAVIVAIGFVIYYFYWLSKVDNGMHGWWKDSKFPLIPTSVNDVTRGKELIHSIFGQFYRWEFLILSCLVIALVYAVYRKNKLIISCYLGILLALFVSYIGMYPINRRLWVFAYPIVIIVVFELFDAFLYDKKNRAKSILLGVFLIILTIGNSGIYYYWNKDNVYWPEYEVKKEMEYLNSIIDKTDNVYVLSCARPIFLYYNEYDDNKLKDKDNKVLVGEESFSERTITNQVSNIDHTKEYEYITNSDKCYIVASNSWRDLEQYGKLYERLKDVGELRIVYNEYDTPLLLFEKH